MKFVSDPPIAVKIRQMQQRVRWQDPLVLERGIDQTRLAIADSGSEDTEFSFMVVGDSGSGQHRGHNPQRRVAEQMLEQQDCRFVLHTGDVIYLVGSSEYYLKNFIEPYREFLVGGERPEKIPYDRMVFNLPFLPTPGNHDYYDLPLGLGLLVQATLPFRRLLQSHLDFDMGWRGSGQGKVYAHAFLDCLNRLGTPQAIAQHLDHHYTEKTETGLCLRYEPKEFTRLPNRYYTFRYGGVDFFALDSNTFNVPLPLPKTGEGEAYRQALEKQRNELEQQNQQILATSTTLKPDQPEQAEQLDDLRTKLEQLEEAKLDIEKQLAADSTTVVDHEQLNWLKQRLVESWHTDSVRGRVIYFHHPPYVTEATKWYQGQTLAIRHRLRQVLDAVAAEIGAGDALTETLRDRPLVDLVLNGHAHCLEYLRTLNTGHADSHLNWIVCGGSGFSLRRQRTEGPELREPIGTVVNNDEHLVARSLLYVGRTGLGTQKRRPYSFLRIDIKEGKPLKFVIRPFVSEWAQRQWKNYAIEPFTI
ncbi:MAG: metallophosphoesterase [Trichocoleus desertorum ATA4-8-CV12]|jgi:3',5'-cyclic AMP phosphodiesterase CpdA|nr:metallophosphoesterase [Trichocoleus desertorum ATA4-8-CV12]